MINNVIVPDNLMRACTTHNEGAVFLFGFYEEHERRDRIKVFFIVANTYQLTISNMI